MKSVDWGPDFILVLASEGSVRKVVRAAVPLPAVGKAVAGKSTDAGLRYIGGIYPHHRDDTFMFGLKPHFLKGCISVSLPQISGLWKSIVVIG